MNIKFNLLRKNIKDNLLYKTLSKKFSIKFDSNNKKYNFFLDNEFVQSFKSKTPKFGFNGLGELVYRRTYSRYIEKENRNEEWFETVKRVVEGTYSLKLNHLINVKFNDLNTLIKNKDNKEIINYIESLNNEFSNESKLMYNKIFDFKFLPPGRGLWAMGTNITNKKSLFAALNNCAFVSTKPKDRNDTYSIIKPYLFLMDSSMLGIGVGFDTKATTENIKFYFPKNLNIELESVDYSNAIEYFVEDSREGWVESVKVLLTCFFSTESISNKLSNDKVIPKFNYSKIRPEGSLLKSFGGVCTGYKVLEDLHKSLINIFITNYKINKNININNEEQNLVTSRLIVDIMNLIGKAVVSGNIRRSAEIALGEFNDTSFINLKNYEINPDRLDYGWVSNNSIYCKLGMDYNKICDRVIDNGEPGFMWLENMQKFSRMCDPEDNKDRLALGGNPCLEQTLESYEMCCLVETFPNHHKTIDEYIETLKYAFTYAKIVTLGMTGWEETNDIIIKNRRIGVSMTGLAQFISNKGLDNLKLWCNEGYKYLKEYDSILSNRLKINNSIKITSIKPSGTVSLLGGATPGMHFPHSKYYIRRIRLKKDSYLVEELKSAGYHIEDDVFQKESTAVASFPIFIGDNVKSINDVSMWEQIELSAFLHKYWADNQVSCTVSFKPKTEGKSIAKALDYFQYQLKGISFLPLSEEKNPYPQMPYEEISKEEYTNLIKNINNLKIKNVTQSNNEEIDKYCNNDTCII